LSEICPQGYFPHKMMLALSGPQKMRFQRELRHDAYALRPAKMRFQREFRLTDKCHAPQYPVTFPR